MELTEPIRHALHFARLAHHGQKRDYTGEPYIHHPIQVATIVSNVGGTEEMVMAALLHDVLEDTDKTLTEIRQFFGHEVGEMVEWLTDEDPGEGVNRSTRKAQNNARLGRASGSVHTIKLADILSNTQDIVATAPELAPIYLPEKLAQIDYLSRGNLYLRNIAISQIQAEMAKLDEKDAA